MQQLLTATQYIQELGCFQKISIFAKIVNDHGFTFIGPKIDHIENMANKIKAKALAEKIGLPIIPGSSKNVETLKEAKKISEKIGYPIIIKSTNGGGGRGIKIVKNENELKKSRTSQKRR